MNDRSFPRSTNKNLTAWHTIRKQFIPCPLPVLIPFYEYQKVYVRSPFKALHAYCKVDIAQQFCRKKESRQPRRNVDIFVTYSMYVRFENTRKNFGNSVGNEYRHYIIKEIRVVENILLFLNTELAKILYFFRVIFNSYLKQRKVQL